MLHTRRDFLKASAGALSLVSLGQTVPTFLNPSLLARGPEVEARDTVLVVVQLAGGNDGLNTVVPYEDDEYSRNRRTLRLDANRVLKIESSLGFHPAMPAFLKLYREGHLTIVQGVGYPSPSGDHAQAMQDWHTGRPAVASCETGWLGRAIDNSSRTAEAQVPGVFVGHIPQPFCLQTESAIVPSIRSLGDHSVQGAQVGGAAQGRHDRAGELAELPRGGEDALLSYLQRSTVSACDRARRIEAVLRNPRDSVTYPEFPLAGQLKTVARLIRADVGVRIYLTELGGAGPGAFDTHANQLGNHAALLRHLSESVACFLEDLKRANLLHRVLLMTFSEFGRTVRENGRRGTGHGSAAPMFLAGGKVRGGLFGSHPSLTDLENGGPRHHIDFRRVYATVLSRWLGFDSESVLGAGFQPLDLLRVVSRV